MFKILKQKQKAKEINKTFFLENIFFALYKYKGNTFYGKGAWSCLKLKAEFSISSSEPGDMIYQLGKGIIYSSEGLSLFITRSLVLTFLNLFERNFYKFCCTAITLSKSNRFVNFSVLYFVYITLKIQNVRFFKGLKVISTLYF